MEKRGLSLADIQEIPKDSLILLTGPPGAGKSSFCYQVVLNNVAADRPVIFVTTEQGPTEIVGLLREKGMGELPPAALSFVDAFSETVGVETPDRPDTICANCVDLNSISIATTRLQERMGRKGILLAFDSLTSPYLFSGVEVAKFMRLFLSKFAAEGNSVLALMDEGCGKEEDLGAMMSVADGIIRMETEQGQRILNVIKHPQVEPAKIPISGNADAPPIPYEIESATLIKFAEADQYVIRSMMGTWNFRKKMGDWVNILWYQLVFWGGLQWDPVRFPPLLYTMAKDRNQEVKYLIYMIPWYLRPFIRLLTPLLIPLLVPKKPSVKTFRRVWRFMGRTGIFDEGHYAVEYLDEISRDDEHHFRKREGAGAWGFPNVGAALCFHEAGEFAGLFNAFSRRGWDWDAVEYM